jgi:hypothetical protein
MANGFIVNAFLNASRWLRGAKDMEESITDLEGALEDAAAEVKDLDKAGDKGFKAIERGAEKAEKETSQLEKRLRDVQDSARDAGKAGDKAGDDIKHGMDRASDGAKDFKEEANSSAREAAASFDGSAQSIGDLFQEVAANAFSGFGPLGAVAGLAAAAGIGLAVAGFEQTAEAQAKSEEAIQGWAAAFAEAGGRIMSEAELVGGVIEIATGDRFQEASDNARNWGVDVSTAMRAMAGDGTALEAVQSTLNDRQAEWTRILEENATGSGASYDKIKPLTAAQQELSAQVFAGREAFEKLNGEMSEGASRAQAASDALYGIVDSATDASIQVDDLGNKIITLPDETQIFIDAKTGQASQNVDRFKGDLAAVPTTKAVTINGSVSLDDSKLRNYRPSPIKVQVSGFDKNGRFVF